MTTENASVAKLKEFYRSKVLNPGEMEKHVKELMGKNDRLIAILGGSLLDAALEGLLMKPMKWLTKKEQREVFTGEGPLSNLASKITMANAFGFLPPALKRNCNYIREIRNAFAHCARPVRFVTPEVKDVCKLLWLDHDAEKRCRGRGPRTRFLFAVVDSAGAIASKRILVNRTYDPPPASSP